MHDRASQRDCGAQKGNKNNEQKIKTQRYEEKIIKAHSTALCGGH